MPSLAGEQPSIDWRLVSENLISSLKTYGHVFWVQVTYRILVDFYVWEAMRLTSSEVRLDPRPTECSEQFNIPISQ